MGQATVAIRIDTELKTELENMAKEQGLKAGVLARHVVLQWLKEHRNKQFDLIK